MRRGRRIPLSLALAALALYATAAAALWAGQERLLFLPDARPLAASAEALGPERLGRFRAERLATADGLDLAFLAAPPTRPGAAVVVVFHGNAGNAADRAPILAPVAAAGHGVVLAGYRGYGGNPGSPSEAGFAEDARATFTWAAERWPGAPLVPWGESLGTGVAARVAEERQAAGTPVAGVVLDSPYTAVADLAAAMFPWLPTRALLRHPFESASRLAAAEAPVLVVHGEEDRVIPASHGRAVAAARAAAGRRTEALFLPGVGHPAFALDRSGRAMAAALRLLDAVAPPPPAAAVVRAYPGGGA